jgi:uncharacterized protein (TIGR03437 family)
MISERSSVAPRALQAITALTIISISFGLGGPRAFAASSNRPEAKLLSVPLSFEPNQGQAASTVQFLARGSGYALFLAPGKVVLNLERQQPASADTLRMSLIGANAKAHAVGLAPQPGVVSYFIGNDPKNWRSGVPTYGKVEYSQIYPGVDLVFYGNQRQLEYDFVVAPGADPSRIAWRIDGARARVDAEGNLVLSADNGPASFKKPVLYQLDGDKKTSVEGWFAVAGNQVRFRLGSYDHSRALIIDPVLSYASYLGGSSTDHIGWTLGPGISAVGTSQGLALDSAGSAYVAGDTYSIDFPTKNPYKSAPPAKVAGVSPGQWPSAFVSKFSADGSSLVYSTYLGGNGYDYIYAIAVDSSGNAYVTGQTDSPDFPATAGAYQTVCSPSPNNTGAPVQNSSNCGGADTSAFVTKLNPTGTGLVYSTFLGGNGSYAYATAIAVDGAGRAYIAGNEAENCYLGQPFTFQSCFPTTSGAVIGGNQTVGGDPQFAFVAAFDPTGAHLLYSTIFGSMDFKCASGCGGTYGTGVAVDANGYFYLVGETQDGMLPTTVGVVQPSAAPEYSPGSLLQAWRGFVAKFNPVTSPGGVLLAYATYLGGHTSNLGDFISGITTDSAGNAYIVGYTNSPDFPVTKGVYSTVCGPNGQNCSAAHVTKLNPLGTAILWSTFVGDSKGDASDALFFTGPIQLDGKGNVYIMGQVGTGFPMVNPVEPTPTSGTMQVLVAELDPAGANLLFSTTIGSHGLNTAAPAGLAVDTAGNIYLAGNTDGPDLITTPGAFQTTSSDGSCCQKGNGFVVRMAATPPLISSVTDGAGYQQGISPGAWISIFGSNLAYTTRLWKDSEILGGKLPTLLDGVSVTIDSRLAAVNYISPAQLNVQVPDDTATGPVQVAVTTPQGTATATVPMQTVSPGLFMYPAANARYVAAQHADYSIVGPPGLYPGASSPAKPGEVIILYTTGFGPTTPPIPSGQVVTSAAQVVNLSAITATIGGQPAPVQWAGITMAGVWQLNVQVPAGAPTGDAAIVAQIGGKSTQGGAFVTVQGP